MTGEHFTASIESISSDGSGVAHAGGLAVFLEMTAPGDLVTARISERRRTWARGIVEKLESPSPHRTAPLCPAYGICGGCNLQHLAYDAQLEAKIRILENALVRIGGLEGPAIRALPSPAWSYRNRVQLHLGKEGPGFHGRRSGETVALADCPVADGGIRRFLGESAAHKKSGLPLPDRAAIGTGGPPAGKAPEIRSRAVRGEAPFLQYRGAKIVPPKKRFALYSRDGVFLIEGGNPAQGETDLCGKKIRLDAGVFFQGNAAMQEILIRDVAAASERADAGGAAADIYAGAGVFAAFLADRFGSVTVCEENPAAVALARQNAGKRGTRFFQGAAETWAAAELKKNAFSFAVADPPRAGMEKMTAEMFARSGPPVFAYVSCDSATFARDARMLCAGGYVLDALSLYDFYPQTAHIEILGVFIRK
jgi:23S rRNA (uracil1939-C5)-methyltransferase